MDNSKLGLVLLGIAQEIDNMLLKSLPSMPRDKQEELIKHFENKLREVEERFLKGGERYIDADKVWEICEKHYQHCLKMGKLPTADVVEVVRCKDCKYYHLSHLQCVYAHHNGIINVDGYCSYGERKQQ